MTIEQEIVRLPIKKAEEINDRLYDGWFIKNMLVNDCFDTNGSNHGQIIYLLEREVS